MTYKQLMKFLEDCKRLGIKTLGDFAKFTYKIEITRSEEK